MTIDEIIKLAREADPSCEHGRLYQIAKRISLTLAELTPETLARFAALVRNEALEEAAGVCIETGSTKGSCDAAFDIADACAAAIRAMKEQGSTGVGSMGEKQTPLIESLERVPQDARVVVEHDQFSSSSHPVGRLCHEAAAELRRLHAPAAQDEALLSSAAECCLINQGDYKVMSVQCQVKPAEIFKVYVPEHLSIDVFQPLIERAGGCTTYSANGVWYSPEGEQVVEFVQVLELVITDEDDNVETCLELLINAGEEYLRRNPCEKALLATACRTSLYFTRDCADNQGD